MAAGMDPAQLDAMSGADCLVTIKMVSGEEIGPGYFGSYEFFAAQDPTVSGEPGTYGIKNKHGQITLEKSTNIKCVDYCLLQSKSTFHHTGVHSVGTFGALIKEGTMEKYATKMFCGWQKRIFRLHETGIVYFTEKLDHTKMIKMEQIQDIRLTNGELHLTWKEKDGTKGVHRLRAGSEAETQEWEIAIKDAFGYSPTE